MIEKYFQVVLLPPVFNNIVSYKIEEDKRLEAMKAIAFLEEGHVNTKENDQCDRDVFSLFNHYIAWRFLEIDHSYVLKRYVSIKLESEIKDKDAFCVDVVNYCFECGELEERHLFTNDGIENLYRTSFLEKRGNESLDCKVKTLLVIDDDPTCMQQRIIDEITRYYNAGETLKIVRVSEVISFFKKSAAELKKLREAFVVKHMQAFRGYNESIKKLKKKKKIDECSFIKLI